ncbi:MAG: YjcQ family protein [Erysipelotrichaceae bacterium]
MPNNFKIIYKMLSMLEKAMSYGEFDTDKISYQKLEISKALWIRMMVMLKENAYIKGIIITETLGSQLPDVELGNVEITLKGLEYLEENSLMQKS